MDTHIMSELRSIVSARLQLLCTLSQYKNVIRRNLTNAGDLKVFSLDESYWEIIPTYVYAQCPICNMQMKEAINTYALHAWSGSPLLLKSYFYLANKYVEHPPKQCEHFMGIHQFLNLHGSQPSEANYLEIPTGEVPLITDWCVPDDVESYAVLDALPICRIEDEQFIPRYTLFSLTYFNATPQAIIRRHYQAEWERGKDDPEFFPGDVYSPRDVFENDPCYDLQLWADRGKLGYLDFTQENLPLRLGPGTRLPELYRNIQGLRISYNYRNGVYEGIVKGRPADIDPQSGAVVRYW